MEENQLSNQSTFIVYFSRILSILLILLVLVLISYLCYFVYINTPRSPENLNFDINQENNSYSQIPTEVHQFHPNMKFNHNNISYQINSDCSLNKKQRMVEAFNILSENVGLISFHEVSNYYELVDIEISCSESEKPSDNQDTNQEKDFFIAGEGGAREIILSGKYNIIMNGTVLLFKSPENSIKCEYPNVELHELIHVFGFDHSEDKNSIMNPYLNSCDQKLDVSIIDELKRLYSIKNLPDLFFKEINAVKKGRYLDFNLTIKNEGLSDAKNVTFSIFDDNELVETSDIGELKSGAGIFIKIINFKLLHLSSKQIVFKIDNDNHIQELDKSNNVAEVKFKS